MSVLDAPLRSLAESLIDTFGFQATYVQSLEGDLSISTGKVTPQDNPITVKLLPSSEARKLMAMSGIRTDDESFIIAALPLEREGISEPSTDDSIEIGDRRLEISKVDPVRSGDQYAMFKLLLRR